MKHRIHLWTVVVLLILNYASSQQISNCCWTEISRKGCDNATILDAIVALPDMNGCKNGWADYCAETVYREFDHCVPDCGDGICAVKSGESCETCPQDCGYCDASKSCANIDETLFSPDDNNTIFEDPFFADQWHIHNTGQQQFSFVATPGNDINVLPVYKQYRIFGKGITVGIVDDGVEWRHPDLQCGYKPELSADIDLDIKFQQPAVFDAHGTCCAGVCCGQGNNTACGIGVAFKANNAGIRVLGNAFSDAKCAEALAYEHTKIDIYSNSWGPADDGATIERYPLALNAISKGIKEGRNGRGAIYVWAAGNGYLRGDGANFDELANSPYTICVGASDWNGKFSTYSEPGANVLCNAPSSTRGYDTQASTWRYYSTMMTADRMGFPGYNRAARSDGNCAIDFGGTSAACPLAAGVLALILEANPRLTWRDMQWIIVKTSTKTDTRHASWKRNAAGYYFSKHYGYGRLDAYKAVTAAKSWTNVCDKYSTYTRKVGLNLGETSLPLSGVEIPKNSTYPLILYASFEDIPDMTVESVSVVISANAKRRGQLVFAVGSAQGTISVLSEGRNNDFGSDYSQQIFTTVQLWGESGKGVWGFSIYDNNRDLAQAAIQSTLTEVQLIIHGSTVDCTSEEIVVTTVGPTKKPVQPTPSSSRDWLPFRVRTIITVVLFSSVSLIVVVVVLVWVFKMQKSAETELNSDIWKEMIEDETTEKKTDQEEESIQEEA